MRWEASQLLLVSHFSSVSPHDLLRRHRVEVGPGGGCPGEGLAALPVGGGLDGGPHQHGRGGGAGVETGRARPHGQGGRGEPLPGLEVLEGLVTRLHSQDMDNKLETILSTVKEGAEGNT